MKKQMLMVDSIQSQLSNRSKSPTTSQVNTSQFVRENTKKLELLEMQANMLRNNNEQRGR